MWKNVKSNLNENRLLDTINDVHNLMLEIYSQEREHIMGRAKQDGITEGSWSVGKKDLMTERMPAGQAIFPEMIKVNSKDLGELVKDIWYLLGDTLLNWVWDKAKSDSVFRLAEKYLKEKGLPWFEEYVVPEIEETYNSAFRTSYQLELDNLKHIKHRLKNSASSEIEQDTPEEILKQMEDFIGFNGLQEIHKKCFIQGRSEQSGYIEILKNTGIPSNDKWERMPAGQLEIQPFQSWERRLEYDPFLFLHDSLNGVEEKIRDTYEYVSQINYEKARKEDFFSYNLKNLKTALVYFIKKHVIGWIEKGKISAENSMSTLRENIGEEGEEGWWDRLTKEKEESGKIFDQRYAPKTIDNRYSVFNKNSDYSNYRLKLNLTDEEQAIIKQMEEELGPKFLYALHKDSFVKFRVRVLDNLLMQREQYGYRDEINFNEERMPGGQETLDVSRQNKIWDLDNIMSDSRGSLADDIRRLFLSLRNKMGEEKIESMNNAYLGFQDKHILKWKDLGMIDAEKSLTSLYSNLSRTELVSDNYWAYEPRLYVESEKRFNQRYSPNTNWTYSKNSSQDSQDERYFRDVINSYVFDGWVKDSYNRGVETALDEIIANLSNKNNQKARMPEGQMGFMPIETFNQNYFNSENDWVYNFAKNRIPHEIINNAEFQKRNNSGITLARDWDVIIANSEEIAKDFIQEYLVPAYQRGWDETVEEYNNKTQLFKEMLTFYATQNFPVGDATYEKTIQTLQNNDLIPLGYTKGETYNQKEDPVLYYGHEIRRKYDTLNKTASPKWDRNDRVIDLKDEVFEHILGHNVSGMKNNGYYMGFGQAIDFLNKNQEKTIDRMPASQTSLFSPIEGDEKAIEEKDKYFSEITYRWMRLLRSRLSEFKTKFDRNYFDSEDFAEEAIERFLIPNLKKGWDNALNVYQQENRIPNQDEAEKYLEILKNSSWKKTSISQELTDQIKNIMYNDFRLKGQVQWQAYCTGLREGIAELMNAFRESNQEFYNEDNTRRTPHQRMITFPQEINQKKDVMHQLRRYVPLEKIQSVLRQSNEKYEPREIANLVEEKILSEIYEKDFISAYNEGRKRIEREIRPFYNKSRQTFTDKLIGMYNMIMEFHIKKISKWFEEDFNIQEGQREAEWEEYFRNEFTSSHGQRSDGEQVVQVETEEVPVEDLDPIDKKKWKKKNPQPSYLDTLPLAMKNSQNKEGEVKWQLM